jgi:hypothetical protein
MKRLGLKPLTVGRLIESGSPLTSAQLAAARDVAASAGLTVEARDPMTQVRVVEVGPRDGLQNEKEPIPTDAKVAFVDALSEAGYADIEIHEQMEKRCPFFQ